MATGMINHFGSALPVFKYVGIMMGIMVVLAALMSQGTSKRLQACRLESACTVLSGWSGEMLQDYTYEETKRPQSLAPVGGLLAVHLPDLW